VNPLWLIPGGVVLVGGAALVALLRNVTEEARLLVDAIARQREVAEAARRLAAEIAVTTRRTLPTRR
jgi:ADP-ribose pyrophosphatase YjhB (NUDIX family)